MISKKLVVAVIAITSICALPFGGISKAYATQRTVNNRTDLVTNPGQYTTIAAAIAASPLNGGDTIIVAGSSINYGDVIVNKKVTIIGTGYNPQKQNLLTSMVNKLEVQNSDVVVSGLVIVLLQSSDEVSIGTGLSNVKIKNCLLSRANNNTQYALLNIQESTTNCEIRECLFYKGGYYSSNLNFNVGQLGIRNNQNQTNLIITNNIFYGSDDNESIGRVGNSSGSQGGVIIKHNLFIRGSYTNPINLVYTDPAIVNARNWVIQDNIFYNVTPATAANTSNCSFINNISYAGDSLFTGYALPNMPPAGNTGSGNFNNTNPLFLAPFATATILSDNWRLQAASPAKNTATDGTDRGPTGGPYPVYNPTKQFLTGEPNVPQVYESGFTNGSAVPPNGTLQLEVKGRKID